MPYNYSPLRYPGGKSQLANYIVHLLKKNQLEGATYCEAFCGGAGVAMKLLLNNHVHQIILNDLDSAIYSIWYALLNDTDRFIDKMNKTNVSMEEWHKQRNIYQQLKEYKSYSFDLAFAAFFLNRTNRSGIIQGGPIGGHSQESKYKIDCRFNLPVLTKKIEKIAAFRNQIHLYNLDGVDFIKKILVPFDGPIFIFFDPPYFHQGQNLYKNALKLEYHVQLSRTIKNLQKPWIVTYDDEPTIRGLYRYCEGWKYNIHYTANIKRHAHELIFKSPMIEMESYQNIKLIDL